ncbi:hypothetical protein [Methanobrevibacter sp.]|uniref:hypothetical protein n=1 Tax=Methanobrevibacter sp. TaxID=66852 RepID=UPI002604F2BB|nr:hypothetical protein [uncultured Methanobrevibacter sp.]
MVLEVRTIIINDITTELNLKNHEYTVEKIRHFGSSRYKCHRITILGVFPGKWIIINDKGYKANVIEIGEGNHLVALYNKKLSFESEDEDNMEWVNSFSLGDIKKIRICPWREINIHPSWLKSSKNYTSKELNPHNNEM